MHVHELLWGRHLVLRAAIRLPVRQLRLLQVGNRLGLRVHAAHGPMCVHVLTAQDRVAWLMWQAPV